MRACSQNRCRGSENYSSRSHLSLEKAAPARRPDIPRTTVSGACARPPARLSTSTHNTHTPGRTRHHLSAVHSSPQRASMSRNDTWRSRVRGNTPAQQPCGLPASTGSAGDSDWQKQDGSSEPPGAQAAAAVRRLPPSCLINLSVSTIVALFGRCARRLLPRRCVCSLRGDGVLLRRPGPVQMMRGEEKKNPPVFQELRRTTVLDF